MKGTVLPGNWVNTAFWDLIRPIYNKCLQNIVVSTSLFSDPLKLLLSASTMTC